jgi:hypothetical protein
MSSRTASILFMLMITASSALADDIRGNKRQEEEAFSRLPVVRAPTQGKAVTTMIPSPPYVGQEVDLFNAPKQDTSPGKMRKSQCISTNSIRTAQVRDDSTIRLTMGKNSQVDMKLQHRCPGLAFDESFYYQPGPTMQLCARLDTITARSGSRCLIDAFVPVGPAPKK